MKVFAQYIDDDNSCNDPDCCGGPNPSPYIRLFSSLEAAKAAGLKTKEIAALRMITVDSNAFERLS